jgi:AcrR family transcriptional regulator
MPAQPTPPAPGRGCYDRSQTRQQRQAEQRDRLMAALAALVTSGAEPTVAGIVARAGVGRNTFYEYFDDVAHALRVLKQRAVRELASAIEESLRSARGPLERLRAATQGWLQAIAREPGLMALALQPSPPQEDAAESSLLAIHLRSVLALLAQDSGVVTALPGIRNEQKRVAVSAVFDALSRDAGRLPPRDDMLRLLSELAAALLR